jgi:cell division protein FtsB
MKNCNKHDEVSCRYLELREIIGGDVLDVSVLSAGEVIDLLVGKVNKLIEDGGLVEELEEEIDYLKEEIKELQGEINDLNEELQIAKL